MILALWMGCATTPVPSEVIPAAKRIDVAPAARPAHPATGDVQAALEGGERFTPEQMTDAIQTLETLGPSAMPAMLDALRATPDDRTAQVICNAVDRLDTRSGEHAAMLLTQLERGQAATAACARAASRTLPAGDPALETLLTFARRRANACWVREAAVAGLRDPSVCSSFASQLDGEGCGTQVAIRGSANCPEHHGRLVELAAGSGALANAALAALLDAQTVDPNLLAPLKDGAPGTRAVRERILAHHGATRAAPGRGTEGAPR